MTTLCERMILVALLTFSMGSARPAIAQDGESLFGIDAPAVTYGPYVRAELGFDRAMVDDGFWESPGASDPIVLFDLDSEDAGFGALGVGFDWMNGFRGELALSAFGRKDVSGPWFATIPATPGPHASVSTSVNSTALMGNVFYAPLERQGRISRFNPYVTAGVGIAWNDMSTWTRTNPDAVQPERSFEGATNTDLAWSVGIGGSWQINRPGSRLILIDASIRYFDLGDAQGGAQPLPGSGNSTPRQPLTFGAKSTVVSIGIRIPLNR